MLGRLLMMWKRLDKRRLDKINHDGGNHLIHINHLVAENRLSKKDSVVEFHF